jgi:hypothetical protein
MLCVLTTNGFCRATHVEISLLNLVYGKKTELFIPINMVLSFEKILFRAKDCLEYNGKTVAFLEIWMYLNQNNIPTLVYSSWLSSDTAFAYEGYDVKLTQCVKTIL